VPPRLTIGCGLNPRKLWTFSWMIPTIAASGGQYEGGLKFISSTVAWG